MASTRQAKHQEGVESAPRMTQKGELRRVRILEAAGDMFLEHGYADTSIDELIRLTGGSKTHIYRGFGSKAELFGAAVLVLCLGCMEEFTSKGHDHLTAERGLAAIGRDFLGMLCTPRNIALQRLVYAEAERFPAVGDIWFREGPERSCAKISEYLAARVAAGELRPHDVRTSARLFHDMLAYTPMSLAMIGQPMDEERRGALADAASAAFLAGHARTRESS